MVSAKGKKKILVIAPILGAIFLFIANGLKIQHWFNINFNCISFHPLLVFTSWGALALLAVVIWATPAKEHWYIKLGAVFWFVGNLFLSFCIWNTYWGI